MDKVFEKIITYFEEKELKDWKGLNITIEEKISEIKKFLADWLPKNAPRMKGMNISTHPCKFIHPSSAKNKIVKGNKIVEVSTSSVIALSEYVADGYVRSGNVKNVKCDTYGDAALMRIFGFLKIEISDGITIFDCIEQNNDISKIILNLSNSSNYEDLRKDFLAMKKDVDFEPCTSSKLKQVYFPINNNDYHQLSVLMPSGIMNKLTKIIKENKFSEKAKQVKEKLEKDEYCEDKLIALNNLTIIGFGGTKPQNISIINNENHGEFYFLSSMPPTLEKNKIKLPKKDFFKDCLWKGWFEREFDNIHKLLKASVNNIKIRESRDNIIKNIFDHVMDRIFIIRSVGIGWSNRPAYSNLVNYQKIMLDDYYKDMRNDSTYLNSFISAFSRWFIAVYNSFKKDEATQMGDDEFIFIGKLIGKQAEALYE